MIAVKRNGWLAAIVAVGALALPATALGFGTINSLGQHAEHEKITRASLSCDASQKPSPCFQTASILSLAGGGGTYGGVGAPDILPPEGPEAHCDNGDYLATPGYPQSHQDANDALLACRSHLISRFVEGLAAAKRMLDSNGDLVPAAVDLSTGTCTFVGHVSGRAKCDVFDGFGRALHGVQDFYAHSNWADQSKPGATGLTNPPGLDRTDLPALLNFQDTFAFQPSMIPAGLITGCFTVGELSPIPFGCSGRVRHLDLNKDEGAIDPVSGVAGIGTTPRGMVGTNFAKAVAGAIRDTQRQWRDFQAALVKTYGQDRANLMICALTHDDPVNTCPGAAYTIPATQRQQETAMDDAVDGRAQEADTVANGLVADGGALIGADDERALRTAHAAGEAIPIGLAVAAAGAAAKAGAATAPYLWGDPRADRRFKRFAWPAQVHVPALRGPASLDAVDRLASRYLQAELRLTQLGVAFQTSLNRAIGARVARSKTWASKQMAHAARLARRGAARYALLAALRTDLAQAILSSGTARSFDTRHSTAAERARSARRVLAGLPRPATKLLRSGTLSRFHILRSIGRHARARPPAVVRLSSIAAKLVSGRLAAAERRLSQNLSSFTLLVKNLRRGSLPPRLERIAARTRPRHSGCC